jgi:hypothetical protein
MMLYHNRLDTNLQLSLAGMNRNTLDRAPNTYLEYPKLIRRFAPANAEHYLKMGERVWISRRNLGNAKRLWNNHDIAGNA